MGLFKCPLRLSPSSQADTEREDGGGEKDFTLKMFDLFCKDPVERGQCVYCTGLVFYGDLIVFKSNPKHL